MKKIIYCLSAGMLLNSVLESSVEATRNKRSYFSEYSSDSDSEHDRHHSYHKHRHHSRGRSHHSRGDDDGHSSSYSGGKESRSPKKETEFRRITRGNTVLEGNRLIGPKTFCTLSGDSFEKEVFENLLICKVVASCSSFEKMLREEKRLEFQRRFGRRRYFELLGENVNSFSSCLSEIQSNLLLTRALFQNKNGTHGIVLRQCLIPKDGEIRTVGDVIVDKKNRCLYREGIAVQFSDEGKVFDKLEDGKSCSEHDRKDIDYLRRGLTALGSKMQIRSDSEKCYFLEMRGISEEELQRYKDQELQKYMNRILQRYMGDITVGDISLKGNLLSKKDGAAVQIADKIEELCIRYFLGSTNCHFRRFEEARDFLAANGYRVELPRVIDCFDQFRTRLADMGSDFLLKDVVDIEGDSEVVEAAKYEIEFNPKKRGEDQGYYDIFLNDRALYLRKKGKMVFASYETCQLLKKFEVGRKVSGVPLKTIDFLNKGLRLVGSEIRIEKCGNEWFWQICETEPGEMKRKLDSQSEEEPPKKCARKKGEGRAVNNSDNMDDDDDDVELLSSENGQNTYEKVAATEGFNRKDDLEASAYKSLQSLPIEKTTKEAASEIYRSYYTIKERQFIDFEVKIFEIIWGAGEKGIRIEQLEEQLENSEFACLEIESRIKAITARLKQVHSGVSIQCPSSGVCSVVKTEGQVEIAKSLNNDRRSSTVSADESSSSKDYEANSLEEKGKRLTEVLAKRGDLFSVGSDAKKENFLAEISAAFRAIAGDYEDGAYLDLDLEIYKMIVRNADRGIRPEGLATRLDLENFLVSKGKLKRRDSEWAKKKKAKEIIKERVEHINALLKQAGCGLIYPFGESFALWLSPVVSVHSSGTQVEIVDKREGSVEMPDAEKASENAVVPDVPAIAEENDSMPIEKAPSEQTDTSKLATLYANNITLFNLISRFSELKNPATLDACLRSCIGKASKEVIDTIAQFNQEWQGAYPDEFEGDVIEINCKLSSGEQPTTADKVKLEKVDLSGCANFVLSRIEGRRECSTINEISEYLRDELAYNDVDVSKIITEINQTLGRKVIDITFKMSEEGVDLFKKKKTSLIDYSQSNNQ